MVVPATSLACSSRTKAGKTGFTTASTSLTLRLTSCTGRSTAALRLRGAVRQPSGLAQSINVVLCLGDGQFVSAQVDCLHDADRACLGVLHCRIYLPRRHTHQSRRSSTATQTMRAVGRIVHQRRERTGMGCRTIFWNISSSGCENVVASCESADCSALSVSTIA